MPDQALGIWAKGVAEDKRAHLMHRDQIKQVALDFIQDQICAVQHPKGATWTNQGDLRKGDQGKHRCNNTQLVRANEFFGMYDAIPQPPTMSTPIPLITDSTTTYSINCSDALLEVLDEVHYQLVTALDCMEVSTEVIHQLKKQDSILIGTNDAMAKRKHLVNERLDSLVGIVKHGMGKRVSKLVPIE